MKPYKLLFLLPLVLFSFCKNSNTKDKTKDSGAEVSNSEQQFTITGKLNNYKVNQIILQELSLSGSQVVLDTAQVDAEGNFTFNGFVREKTFANINLGQSRNVFFIVDTNTNINTVIDGSDPLTYSVSNDKENQELAKIVNLTSQYVKERTELQVKAQSNPTMTSEERNELQKELQKHLDKLKTQAQEEMKGFKYYMPQVFAIEFFQLEVNSEQEKSIIEGVSKEPNNQWFAMYRPKAEARIKTSVGAVAPEISLKTPQGETLSLSSLRGKYVLIDFWASWCGPCRAENPNVIKVYNKYKDKGFEILGVSLDKEENAWKQAIAQDGLPWKHVSDLKYWQSEAAVTYSVQAIPQTFLIDKEGVIVAKGLRGAELEEKLAEVFN